MKLQCGLEDLFQPNVYTQWKTFNVPKSFNSSKINLVTKDAPTVFPTVSGGINANRKPEGTLSGINPKLFYKSGLCKSYSEMR